MTMNESKSAQESSLELKYCERCGGLWLRPAGGGQIYCVSCARAMGELPPATYRKDGERNPQMPQGPRKGMGRVQGESYERYVDFDFDLDAEGGVA